MFIPFIIFPYKSKIRWDNEENSETFFFFFVESICRCLQTFSYQKVINLIVDRIQ